MWRKRVLTDLAELQEKLGVTFSDLGRLRQALLHSSYANENPDPVTASNERLEFLGDAVLGLVVAEKLYQDFPGLDEGEMTKLRAALVRRETLVRTAQEVGLGDYLYLGKGEEASGGRQKPANLAAALEAVVAAVFLDRGQVVVRDFVIRLLDAKLKAVVRWGGGVDYKSELQEFVQAQEQRAPIYHVIETVGPQHGKTFTVEVRLGKTVLGQGWGRSKKAAETEAARAALEKLSSNFTQ